LITREDIRRLLQEKRLFASAAEEELGVDTELVWDSMSLIWLLHGLEQEYGIQLSPEDGELGEFSSVRKIHRYIEQRRTG
jgi:acyl carrier protein